MYLSARLIEAFLIPFIQIKVTKRQGICIEDLDFLSERLYEACGQIQDVLLNEVKNVSL